MCVAFAATPAEALRIEGSKDALFAWPKVLSIGPDRAFFVVDYDEMRDINGRDDEPERRVNSRYVTALPGTASRMRVLEAAGRRVEIGEAGTPANARFAVIFVHGRAGDRRLGMDDRRFGGNFNRLKNLAVRNGGVYVAPTVKTFDAEGRADVAAIIASLRAASPGAPIVLACGSMGAMVCSAVARDSESVARLAGMVLLGGAPDGDLADTALVKARVPVVFTHGSADETYSWETQKRVFDRVRAGGGTYPTRFVLFQSGSHGTPIRMTDWKDVLNWIFANTPRR
ncbi:alpha/beta fold hydrolase [Hoeflea marina]|uniref:alpha/beta fold hydrolase n=1 Tax=Hoeflea marina TaxID=274592 RepID=UPI003CCA0BE2